MRRTLLSRKTSDAEGGRRSRVVLTPRRWRQVFAERSARATVAKQPGHRGELGISRKPLRREGRIVSANLWRLRSCAFFVCARGCGCGEHPAFPAPSAFSRPLFATTRTDTLSREWKTVSSILARTHPSRCADLRRPVRCLQGVRQQADALARAVALALPWTTQAATA